MASFDEVVSAVKIVREFAGNPTVGVVKELLDDLEASVATKPTETKTSTSTKEVRVVDVEETR
jgi:hypothetical protein